MVRLLPVASGKGGVGKSVIVANLGLALAALGRTVVLVDLDLGGSNLHTCLGLRNRQPGVGSLVWRREKHLAGLLVETGRERLWMVGGDGLLPGTANLDWQVKRKLLRELALLPADFVILDLGAGSAYNVVDFFVAAPDGLLVLAPEITSTLNAYSLLKTAAYRVLQRALPERGEERELLAAFASTKTEGSGRSFLDFADSLAASHPERGAGALAALKALATRVVMNRGRTPADAELGYRLRDIAAKNLGLSLGFEAFLLEDPGVGRSVAARVPLLELEPSAPFSRGIRALATRLARAPRPESGDWGEPGPDGDEGEGLDSLAAEAFAGAGAAGARSLP